MYELYDDCGTIIQGTREECLEELKEWLEGTELESFDFIEPESLYNEDEIGHELILVNRALRDDFTEFESSLGFSLREIEEN